MRNSGRTLVLGIGNLLMGDEGIGVHAVRQIEEHSLPPGVDVLDGGTGGFHLLALFEEYPRIIMIDATMDGKPAGTLTTLMPRFSSEFPRTLSAHDIGLRDLVETAELLGHSPVIHLITISIDQIQSMVDRPSPEVLASLPAVREVVLRILPSDQTPVVAPI